MEVGTSAVLERLTALGIAPVAAGTNMAVPALAGAVSTTGISGKQIATPNANQPTLDGAAQSVSGTGLVRPLLRSGCSKRS